MRWVILPFRRWIVGRAANLNGAEVAYASFHQRVDLHANIDRFAYEKAKHAASVVANRRSARGSTVAVIYFRPAADSAKSISSDRAIEDGAAEIVDELPEHSSWSGFYCDEAHVKPLRQALQPKPAMATWL